MDNSEFAEGVKIISKYLKGSDEDFQAGQDQVWFGYYDDVTDDKDVDRLLKLGWFEDKDAWSCYS